jgi:NAD(P)-dependent dehydrogenase (short-subunit alcohol dehydrogenase family)
MPELHQTVAPKTFGATSTTDEVLEGVSLSGKRMLVTGVSAGLGVETARALVAHGAEVIGAARDLAKAEAATAGVRAAAAKGGKTIPQGAATTVWAGAVAPADEIGGRYCEDCRVAEIVADPAIRRGVKPYALDPEKAKALWAKCEAMVGERF